MPRKLLFILILLALFFSACSAAQPVDLEATTVALAETAVLLTAQANPTATHTATPVPTETPTETPVPTDTATPIPSDTPTPTETPTATPVGQIDPNLLVNYFFVTDAGGPIGCGDFMFKVHIGIYRTFDPITDTFAALSALFNNHNQFVAGLFNPLWSSNVAIDEIYMGAKEIQVIMTGRVDRGDFDQCDWVRFREQAKATSRDASGGIGVNLMLNDKPYNDWFTEDIKP